MTDVGLDTRLLNIFFFFFYEVIIDLQRKIQQTFYRELLLVCENGFPSGAEKKRLEFSLSRLVSQEGGRKDANLLSRLIWK